MGYYGFYLNPSIVNNLQKNAWNKHETQYIPEYVLWVWETNGAHIHTVCVAQFVETLVETVETLVETLVETVVNACECCRNVEIANYEVPIFKNS